MQADKVGDIVVHWSYGAGKIVAIAKKGLPGHPCSCYIRQDQPEKRTQKAPPGSYAW